jgi:prolyl oligopeptidase
MRAAVVFLLMLAMSHTTTAQPDTAVPATPRREVRESLHGTDVVDPFRWLEGDDKGEVTPEVAAWTDAQNARTRATLDNMPGRKQLEDRIRALLTVGSISAPSMRGERYFYSKRTGTESQSSVYLRTGEKGDGRRLLDPALIDPSGLTTISFYNPCPAGRYLAFGIYKAGDENTTAYILDIDRNVWLADELPGKVGGLDWLPDSSGFIYRRLADTKNPYSGQILLHTLGTHPRQDRLIFEQFKEGPLATTWGPGASISDDARWLLLSYWTSTRGNDLAVADFDRFRRTGELKLVDIAKGIPARFSGAFVGDTLFMQTTHQAPNGRIVAVDLHRPGPEHWKTIVPERKDVVIDSFSVARGVLVLDAQTRAHTLLERYRMDGTPMSPIDLGGPASAGVSARFDRTEAYVSLSGFERQPSIHRVDLAADTITISPDNLWERVELPVDTTRFTSSQVTYSSKDGTPVTMFLVHRKGLELNGDNPTLLTGYGGFGIGQMPGFRSTAVPFMEDGGVLAIPNLRGGNEYGNAWHEAALLSKKQNTFDDFEAAARWLIASKYTNPRRLAISGGSNGGLLVGAAIAQNPDLYAAVVCQVPLLDMLRYQNFLMARYWVPEYGTAENPEHLPFLLAYSPYHNLKPGLRYPAAFITAGENDTRVHPLHARKFAALLQDFARSSPDANPTLLWVDRSAGHGGGKPLDMTIRDIVDAQMFIRWRLGMK